MHKKKKRICITTNEFFMIFKFNVIELLVGGEKLQKVIMKKLLFRMFSNEVGIKWSSERGYFVLSFPLEEIKKHRL